METLMGLSEGDVTMKSRKWHTHKWQLEKQRGSWANSVKYNLPTTRATVTV